MKIRTLAEWFDDLPEGVKDALSELIYERDLNNFEARMNDFIAESVRFSYKDEENASEALKMPQKRKKIIKIDPEEVEVMRDQLRKEGKLYKKQKNFNTPITEEDINEIRQKLDCGFDILPF